jgi:outer membrane protein OmpA-like peptidoglycan-associated protein
MLKNSNFATVFLGALMACAGVWGAEPSTQQMIEQLKPPPTRSLRNLTVEAAPAVSGAPVAPLERPSLSLLIQFDFDSARVSPRSQQALVNLSQALQSAELLGSRFAIEGHTDAVGNPAYNQKLSEQRALAVRDFLQGQGVEPQRLVASGKGSSALAVADRPFAPENRRVRIENLE